MIDTRYQQILEDLIFDLDLAGQEYTPAKAELWAWERFMDRYPEYTPAEAWNG